MEAVSFELKPINGTLELPEINTVADWFKDDQNDRIQRLRSATQNIGPYSVYDVYNSKGAL